MAAFRTARLAWALLAVLGLASAAGAAQLQLNWSDQSSNETGFEIWRKTGTGGTYAQIAVSPSNTTSYADTTVTAGVTYCYQVRAYNDAGESDPTNEACGTATATTGSSPTTSTPASGAPASNQAASSTGAGDGGGGGGCFIATAAFGSPLAPQVQLLREVRDEYLLPNRLGRVAVQVYYAVSPPIAEVIRQSELLRAAVRLSLIPVLAWAALTLWSPGLGLAIPLLPVIVGVWLARRRSPPS